MTLANEFVDAGDIKVHFVPALDLLVWYHRTPVAAFIFEVLDAPADDRPEQLQGSV